MKERQHIHPPRCWQIHRGCTNKSDASRDTSIQRLLPILSWQHVGQPPLIHSRQSMGNCWMQGRMNACYVTKHGTSMIETKTNGVSPALKEFNQMEKTKKIIVSQCAAISYWWPCYALWQHRMISYGKWHRGNMHFWKGRMSENVGRIKEVFIKRIAFELGHKQNLKFCHVL